MTQKPILFSDFDGTITDTDVYDFLVDQHGMGKEKRSVLAKKVLAGDLSFRDYFEETMNSVNMTYKETVDACLGFVKLTPGFKEFYQFALDNGIRVIIVSSGMEPLIRELLEAHIGDLAKTIEIEANQLDLDKATGRWKLVFHDDSEFGHDKSLTIRKFHTPNRPPLLFSGDGMSDMSAAKETDWLFVKAHHDLVHYCNEHKIPFTEFETFTTIEGHLKTILAGKESIAELREKYNSCTSK